MQWMWKGLHSEATPLCPADSVGKPYECNECDESFTHQSIVRLHQRIHTGVKPCICTECRQAFIQKTHLVAHQKIHSGKKPYECSDYGTSFPSKSQLHEHSKTHTGKKPIPAQDVGRSSPKDQTSLYTRRLGLDKELMFILNVEGPSLTSQSWWHIREFILVKNLMNAVTVVKSLRRSHTSLYTWMFILEGNLLYGLNEKHPELPHDHSSNTSPLFSNAALPLVPYEPSWLPHSCSGISQKGTVPSWIITLSRNCIS